METLKNRPDDKIIADILKRISQIVSDTGYGRIYICIQQNEVQSIEHTVTRVFRSSLNKQEKSFVKI
jgi:hypothetical protein